MNVYLILVITALLFKGSVMWLARKSHGETKVFLGLILMFGLHNACELLIYLQLFQGYTADMLLKAYYVLSIMVVTWMCLYSNHVVAFKTKLASNFILAIGVLVSILFQFTSLVIVGAEPLGDVVTAIKGPYYFVFQLTMIGGFVFVITSLIWGRVTRTDSLIKARCSLVLLALMPVILSATAIIVLMQLNIEITAAGLIPVSTTLFLVLILKMEQSHRLTDIRVLIPGSVENKVLGELIDAFSNYSIYDENHKETLNEIERVLVLYKHRAMSDKKTTEIAKAMGMPRPTLYSIYDRLGLKDSIKVASKADGRSR